jgi:hypothetical protein
MRRWMNLDLRRLASQLFLKKPVDKDKHKKSPAKCGAFF